MRTLVFNCCPVRDGATAELVRIIAEQLSVRYETETACIADYDFRFCTGCRSCHETGVCALPADGVSAIMAAFEAADIIIMVSPSYWADVPGQCKAFIDRCTPWSNTHEPHAALSGGKKGYAAVLRTGPNMRECERLLETISHFYGHLDIPCCGTLGLTSVAVRADILPNMQKVLDFCDMIGAAGRKRMLQKKQLYRDLLAIVAPIAFQYLMSSLVTASDAFMLGFLDQTPLSAASLAGQIAFVFSLFYGAFVGGLSVLAAQYWGKNDRRTVEAVYAMTMRYALATGLLFTAAAALFPQLIMRIFTSDPALIRLGAQYLRTVALSYVLTGFSQASFGIMKICGQAGLSSLIGSLSVVLNIVLNYVLIFGAGGIPQMGIAGAALATVIARVFETVFVLVLMRRGKCLPLRIRMMLRGKHTELRRDYWKYTVPLLLNQLGWGGGVTMYSVIMGHLGNDATAANSIAGIVRGMIASFCWGIATGVGILLGGMLGRGELDDAKKAGGSFVRFSLWVGAGSGLIILALTPLVLRVTTLTGQAQVYLKYMMLMASYYIIGNSLNSTVISGIFPAGGDTRFGMICDIVTLWCVVVPLGMIAAFVLKLPVLAVAFILTLDEFVKIPAVYRHYMKYEWIKNLTKEQELHTEEG